MGGQHKASAIPDYLYSYSSSCTDAAQGVQDWLRQNLPSAIQAYLRGASGSSGVTVDISAVRAIAGNDGTGLTTRIAKRIADAYYLDRGVHATGLAFQEAGASSGVLANPNSVVRLPDEKALDAADTKDAADMAAGAALANRLRRTADVKQLAAELAAHADDPAFCAGFLNALAPTAQQRKLPVSPGSSFFLGQFPIDQTTIPALVAALSHGGVDQSIVDDLVHKLVYRWPDGVDTKAFLAAVAANPGASANLAASLTSPQIYGLLSPNRGTEGAGPALLNVLTLAAAQQHDPEQLKALVEKLTHALVTEPPEGTEGAPRILLHMDPTQLRALLPSLLAFVHIAAPALVQPMPEPGNDPHRYQKELTTWGQEAGQDLRVFEALGTWVDLNTAANDKQAERNAGGWVTLFGELAVGFAAFFGPEVEGPVAALDPYVEVFIHSMLGAGVYAVEPSITKMITEPDIEKYDQSLAQIITREIDGGTLPSGESRLRPDDALRKYIWLSARAQLVLRALNSGRVTRGSHPVTLADVTGKDGLARLPGLVADRNNDWAKDYEVQGTGKSLADLLNALGNQYPDPSLHE